MPFLVLVLVSTSLLNGIIIAAPVSTYDQKQYGDLNVQVDLKDIEIVAMLNSGLLGDYGEYDYAYDYSDFTSKPSTSQVFLTSSSSPSSTISTTTVKTWETWPTVSTPKQDTEVTDSEISIASVKLTVDTPTSSASSAVEESATVETPSEPNEPEKINQGSTAASALPKTYPVTETQNRVLRRCNPGLARDQRGRCRLLVRRRIETGSSILPYGIKLTSQIHRLNDHRETTEN